MVCPHQMPDCAPDATPFGEYSEGTHGAVTNRITNSDISASMPQIMARSRYIILKHKSKWNDQQRIRARILFGKFPDLEKAYALFLKLVDIFNEKTSAGVARLNLARWYNEVEAFGNNEFNKVLETFEIHNTTIVNYFERRLTNASAESFNAKIKAFRTQFRSVGDIKFSMFRLATLYS